MLKDVARSLFRRAGFDLRRSSLPPYGVEAERDIVRYARGPVRTVFDVGANIGQTASMFHERFPEAKIYSFEPVAATYRALQASTSHLPRVRCVPLALGSEPGAATVWMQADSQQNSLNPQLNVAGGDEADRCEVKVDTVDRYAEAHGISSIDVLKMDTENFDLQVLGGAERLLNDGRISFVLSEVSFDSADRYHTFFGDLLAWLEPHGFEFMSAYERLYDEHGPRLRTWCNALFIRRNLLAASDGGSST